MATIQSKGIFLSLVAQLDKLARHNRQGSFRTKARYYEACKRFCAYLAAEYHLQKLENISGKHLVSYVLYLQDNGKSASTVKTDSVSCWHRPSVVTSCWCQTVCLPTAPSTL